MRWGRLGVWPTARPPLRPARESEGPVIICGFACTGCAALGRPDWTQPGPAKQQQRRAVRFDPYLQDDIAPSVLRMPLMDGARPRDFANPVP